MREIPLRRATAADAGRAEEQTRGRSGRETPFRAFVGTETSSAVVLLAAVVVALVWANSPWSASYERLWTTPLSIAFGAADLTLDLRHWVNDGLMALFFFVVGLEIRREFDMGELRERRRVATPVLAAIGGMVVPAAIYAAVNVGEPTLRGWGIVMGTDTAFALGVLALVGRRCPPSIRIFLLTLVIVDDIVALTVIAVVYTEELSVPAFFVAVALLGAVLVLRRAGVRHGVPYFVVGAAMWVATLVSGVHATIAGVALGLLATAYPPSREELERAGRQWRMFREEPTPAYATTASRTLARTISPNERLQHLFHGWTSFVIVPVFALANAGIEIDGAVVRDALSSPVTLGIVAGLVVGKPVGIVGTTWIATRPWLGGFPLTVGWPPLIGAATLAGIGFTVSLLIADISLAGEDLLDAKLGVLGASVLATALAAVVFRAIRRIPDGRPAGRAVVAEPLVDLAEPVDEEVDHVRGPQDAPVTLVEYGDFECPYCHRAEPVVRELLRAFETDVRFVFRHLPLVDVHERAELAAEAAEAAAAQGRFWEMHDLLFERQDALGIEDLERYATELGLDVERFSRDLTSRRHALRIARDVESADAAGVAGTPTFFVNGRRHRGAYDADSLSRALVEEVRRVRGRPVAGAR